MSAVYALLVAVFIYKDLTFKQLPEVFLESAKTTVMLMFIVANALLFAHVLTTERIPQAIAEQILAVGMTPWMFLLVVNVILLVAGNFMEPTGIILILAPILFPIAVKRAALPWLMVLLVFLVIITYVPVISLGLPDMLFGKAT